MPKRHVVEGIVRKFDEVQHEIDAHHWLLVFVLFLFAFQMMTAWSLADLREGLIASAAGQQKIIKEISSQQQQITSLRDELNKLQGNNVRQNTTADETSKAEAVRDSSPAPASSRSGTTGGSDRQPPKVKQYR